MKKGRALEILVGHLERVLTDSTYVTIESPKKLRDVTNDSLREHDVVLTITQGHHEVLVAIECRDRARPITSNQVEGFWKKCQDTGVNQGVIVSPKGFWKKALTKAQHLGIRCLSLDNALCFNWLVPPGITIFHRNLLHTHWTIIPESAVKELLKGENPVLVAPDDAEVTLDILQANVIRKLNDTPIETASGRRKVRFFFKPGDIRLRLPRGNQTVAIEHVVAEVEYEVSITLAPFDLKRYADAVSGETITDAAIANLEIGAVAGKLVIAYNENRGGSVSFLSSKKSGV
jgi:hypothetical protein